MNKKCFNTIYLFSLCLGFYFFSSCSAYKKLPYLTNIDSEHQARLITDQGVHEAKIKPNDLLSITVSSTIPGAANDFNLPVVPSVYDQVLQTSVTGGGAAGGGGASSLQDYLVDKAGLIRFPIFGDLKVAGMSVRELEESLTKQIYPRYISMKPIVTVRLLNFKVSVLGEVTKPGTYQSENGEMTIFDALAAAGDLTLYAKRNNVMLIRTTETGDVVTYRVNLQDKNSVANKDIFYLQQSDKLYVETNKAKGNNSQFGTLETFGLSAISLVVSVAAFITRF
ncbi:MAG: yccZ [Bacteroidetes bacterium]|nr:yccZ [Bacteroidota bacterium]